MSISNAGDTTNVDTAEAFDGVYEYHSESSGILSSFSGTLGTSVGIGGYIFLSMDTWEFDDGTSGPSNLVILQAPREAK